MEEDSLHYWVIPIICMVAVMGIFFVTIEYRVNTIIPNAVLEKEEIKKMSCPEIMAKDSANKYWTAENSAIGKAKAISCNPPAETKSSGLSPYVEFCNPGGFAPNKLIENSTHRFNHDTCTWGLK